MDVTQRVGPCYQLNEHECLLLFSCSFILVRRLCANSRAESRGVEPHPISENLVFKASRRTIPAALLSINLAPSEGIEPPFRPWHGMLYIADCILDRMTFYTCANHYTKTGKLGTLPRTRTERTLPFERSDFARFVQRGIIKQDTFLTNALPLSQSGNEAKYWIWTSNTSFDVICCMYPKNLLVP